MNAKYAAPIIKDLLEQIESKHPDSGVYFKLHTQDGNVVTCDDITTHTDETGNLIVDFYE